MRDTVYESPSERIIKLLEYIKVSFICFCYYFDYLVQKFIIRHYKDLSKEIILVTGSGRGIGHELCLELAKTGATIVCWSRSASPNEELVQKIKKLDGTAFGYTVDVGDRQQVQKTAELVRKEVGDVTMLINNAGLMKVNSILDTAAEDIQEMFRVNVVSNFWIVQAFLPAMIEKRYGHIVTVNSASGILPTYSISAYSSTKHAQHGFIEALRQEIAHHPLNPDIKFTTAFPFYCKTDMLDHGIPNTRVPKLLPILSVEEVATEIVKGIRREEEYIYIPKLIGWLAMCSWLVTPKAIRAHGDFLKLHIDPLEKKSN